MNNTLEFKIGDKIEVPYWRNGSEQRDFTAYTQNGQIDLKLLYFVIKSQRSHDYIYVDVYYKKGDILIQPEALLEIVDMPKWSYYGGRVNLDNINMKEIDLDCLIPEELYKPE